MKQDGFAKALVTEKSLVKANGRLYFEIADL
jgi:hypothetical protein